MSDPVAAVTEADATGETAAIFADIRAVYGVSVVKLIWRHLATFPGALPWAWGAVRPLYVSGAIARQADTLRATRRLPATPAIPAEVFAAAGLTEADLRQVGTVLDAYERTNPMALVALSVLEQQLDAPAGPAQDMAPVTGAHEAALRLPPLMTLDRMAPATAALVLRLNRIGAARPDPVLASMYRNLAWWPSYLALAWAVLAPHGKTPELAAAIQTMRAEARIRAAAIAQPPPAALPVEQRAAVAEAIDRFAGDALCRMVVVCAMLRAAGTAGANP